MKNIIIGTAGHIDHGKTALVRALTGVDTDRLKEEKERGITIDIGFADLMMGDVRIGFVDVPGHERFVKNMLAGAHGIDLVMLVVAADESIMPQTREHFDICRLLNVKSGLVALTKSDLVDADLLELARSEVEDFVRGSFLESGPVVAVSSRTGRGIDELKAAIAALVQATPPKTLSAPPRLPVDRSFSIKGFGTVVTGTLIAGELKVGDEVEVLPSGKRTRIRNLQTHGQDTERAFAGQRTAVNLQGVEVDQVQRGSVLAEPGRIESTAMLDARLELLESCPRPLGNRARVRLHHGTAEVMARVVPLGQSVSDFKIEPGARALVQLRLEEPVTALPGDRFIIRSYSPQVTIGGGVVIDSHPEKHRRSDLAAQRTLEDLESSDRSDQVALFVEMAGARGMTRQALGGRTGIADDELTAFVEDLVKAGRIVEISGSPATVVSAAACERLARSVLDLLGEHHRREPLSLGLSREEVRERVFGKLKPEIFRAVIARLVAEGKIAADRDALKAATHQPALSGDTAAAKDRLEAAFRKSSLQALTIEEAAAAVDVQVELARKLYNLLVSEGRLTRIGDMVFHSDSLEQLKARVRARKRVSLKMDVGVFKEITGGLSRKYAIPLLEYLDRERITRRVGNEREIL